MRYRHSVWMMIVGYVALSTLMWGEAQAYVRTRTCTRVGSAENTNICRPNQDPRDVYWASTCITYYVNRKGSAQLGGLTDELLNVIQASFDTWANVPCSSIQFALGGFTCNESVGLEDEGITGGNQNLIVWQEDNWGDATDAIAITVVSPSPTTGEILDADIVMNGEYFTFAILDNPNDTVTDVQNTLTHEIGHLIGFNHETDIPESTMFPKADAGDLQKRDLHPDDELGLCTVYPGNFVQNLCVATPVQDLTCTLEYGGELNCATPTTLAPVQTSSWGTKIWLVLMGIFAACALTGRIRRGRGAYDAERKAY